MEESDDDYETVSSVYFEDPLVAPNDALAKSGDPNLFIKGGTKLTLKDLLKSSPKSTPWRDRVRDGVLRPDAVTRALKTQETLKAALTAAVGTGHLMKVDRVDVRSY